MSDSTVSPIQGREVGRYVLYSEIAAGGMATIHLGRLCGPAGFSRTVALKRLHPQLASDPHFVSMFLDEARLAGRIQHPNAIVPVDVVVEKDELFLVMEYVAGETLGHLLAMARSSGQSATPSVIGSVLTGVLHGLHAAHEALSEQGEALNIVHRDVSPQNIMVGREGIGRILDFGVAKAASRVSVTAHGAVRGKIGYMAPEQLCAQPVDRRTDIFAAGIVLWEALTLEPLFRGATDAETIGRVLRFEIPAPSSKNSEVLPELDAVVLRALAREPSARFQTAEAFAHALEDAVPLASRREVEAWVAAMASDALSERAERVSEIESSSLSLDHLVDRPPSSDAMRCESIPPGAPGAFSISVAEHDQNQPKVRDRFGWAMLSACISAVIVLALMMPLPQRSVSAASGNDATAELVPRTGTTQVEAIATRTSDKPAEIIVAPVLVSHDFPAASSKPAQRAVRTATQTKKRAAHVTAAKALTARPAEAPMREAPKSKCDPPYVVDARGIRRVKPECM